MSSDRLILEHRTALSLSKAHKRLAGFIDRQLAAQPTLSTTTSTAVDDAATAAQLRAVDRVKVPDHIIYQLQRIRDAIEEERQREKGAGREGKQDASSSQEAVGKKRRRDADTAPAAAAAVDADDGANLVESSISGSSKKKKKHSKDKKRRSTAVSGS